MRRAHRDTHMPGKALLWSEEAFTGTHNTEAHTETGFKCPHVLIYNAVCKGVDNIVILRLDAEHMTLI